MSGPVEVASTPAAVSPAHERAELRRAAEAFEALLLQQLLKTMREAQLEDGFFGGSAGASTWEGVFEQGLAEQMAAGSPLGVADMLERAWSGQADGREQARQLLRRAEEASRPLSHLDSSISAPIQVIPEPADEKYGQEPRGGSTEERGPR